MNYEYKYLDDAPIKIRVPKNYEKYIHQRLPHAIVYDRFKKKAHCLSCGEAFRYSFTGNEGDDKETYEMKKFYAGDYRECPVCGRMTRVEPHTGMWNARTQDAFFWADKGDICFATTDAWYRYDPAKWEHLKEITATIYVDQMGRIGRSKQVSWISWCTGEWSVTNKVCAPGQTYTKLHPSFERVIKGSFLKHCEILSIYKAISEFNWILQFVTMHAKYPQMEYIQKLGLQELIFDKLYGRPNFIRPNWKKTTLPGLLGISNQDIEKLKQWNMFSTKKIGIYKQLKKTNPKLTKKTMLEFLEFFTDISVFQKSLKGLNPLKVAKYIEKEYERNMPECSHGAYGYDRSRILVEYIDYISQMRQLEYPQTDYYLYPKSLKGEHDRVSEELRMKMDKEVQGRYQKKQEVYEEKYLLKLKKLTYKDDEFLIRPLEDYLEFSNEGRKNNNCVASYYIRATEGKTAMFTIRKISAPEEPFYTLELNNNKIRQCRGKGNCSMTSEIEEFVNRWVETVIKGKKKGKVA